MDAMNVSTAPQGISGTLTFSANVTPQTNGWQWARIAANSTAATDKMHQTLPLPIATVMSV